jgi:hypothetical protein
LYNSALPGAIVSNEIEIQLLAFHQELPKLNFSVALPAKKIQGDFDSLYISKKQVTLPKGNTILRGNLFSKCPDLAIVKGSFRLS